MKQVLWLLLLCLCASGALVAQTGVGAFKARIEKGDGLYKEASNLHKKADALKSSGNNKEALAKYNAALKKYEDANDYYKANFKNVGITESEKQTVNGRIANVNKQIKIVKAAIAALNKQPTRLEVSETDLSFGSDVGSEKNITIKGDNWKYNSEELPSWIKCIKTATGLSIDCKPNVSIDSRTFTIVITSDGDYRSEIQVRQRGAQEYLSVSQSSLNFGESGGTKDITVETNSPDYSVQSNSSWLQIDKNSSYFRLTCSSNPNRDPRNAQIVVKTNSGNHTSSINIQQDKKSLHLPFDAVSLRVGGSFEASLDFYLTNDMYIDASIGMWNIIEYGASAYGATATFTKEHELGSSDFYLYYGGGVGLGIVESTFAGKFGGVIGVEYWLPISIDLSVTLDYRPDIGVSFVGLYSNLINFNAGVKYYF